MKSVRLRDKLQAHGVVQSKPDSRVVPGGAGAGSPSPARSSSGEWDGRVFHTTIRAGHLDLVEYASLTQGNAGFDACVQQRPNTRQLHSTLSDSAPEVFDQQEHTRHQDPDSQTLSCTSLGQT